MANLDFPSSPINGQTYTVNGVVWTYNSAKGVWSSYNSTVVNQDASYTWTNTHTFETGIVIDGATVNSTSYGGTANNASYLNGNTASDLMSYADTVGNTAYSNAVSYADTAIANLVDSAPSTLDTLNELAAALGDDVNFSTTVTNSLASKAPTVDPTFTGNAAFDTDTLFVDATNNRIGIGTSSPGQKLTVAGTVESTSGGFKFPDGTTQTSAAAGGGAWNYITSVTASSSSYVTFDSTYVTTDYDAYMVTYHGVSSSSGGNQQFIINVTTDNFASMLYGYSAVARFEGGTSPSVSAFNNNTDIRLAVDVGNSGSSYYMHGRLVLYGTSSSALWKGGEAHTSFYSLSQGNASLNSSGISIASTSDIDGIRFKFSGANIATGIFRLYGLVSS